MKTKYFSILLVGFLLVQPGFSASADSFDDAYNSSWSTWNNINYSSSSNTNDYWGTSNSTVYSAYSAPSTTNDYWGTSNSTVYSTPSTTNDYWGTWNTTTYTPYTPTYTYTPVSTYASYTYPSTYYSCTSYCPSYYSYDGYYYSCPQPCSYYSSYAYSNYYKCSYACPSYAYYDGYYYYCSQPCSYSSCTSSCCGSSCYQPQPNYPSLSVSCSASPNPAQINQPVTFSAYASGGTGSYYYTWTGDCTSSSQTCYRTFYIYTGNINTTVTVTSGGQTASATCSVNVQGNPQMTINKLVRNISDSTGFQDSVTADPGDRLEFSIQVTSTGSSPANNVRVTDSLPYKISYQGNLRVDGGYSGGDIVSGISLGSLSVGQSKTIVFEALVSSSTSDFSYGTSTLTNYARVSADNFSQIEDTALVNVYRYYQPQSPGVTITKTVKNVTDNTGWVETVSADPNESLSFSLYIYSNGTTTATNVQVKDVLPSKISYQGNLRVDGSYNSGDILNGINIGSLSNGQSKTITFDAKVASESEFSTGTTNLINTAKTWADGLSTIEDTAVVNVYRGTTPTGSFSIQKQVKNLSDGTAFQEVVPADPNEIVTFSLQVTASVNAVYNVTVKDSLPAKMTYYGNLKVDNVASSGDIFSGLNIGDISANQTKTITFDAKVGDTSQFVYGTTELINAAIAYNTSYSVSDTAKVTVTKAAVAGAITEVVTGVNPLYLSLMIALLLSLAFYFLVLPRLENSKFGYKIKLFLFR